MQCPGERALRRIKDGAALSVGLMALNSQWKYAPVLRRGLVGPGRLQVFALFKDVPSCYATALQQSGNTLMQYLMHHSVGY